MRDQPLLDKGLPTPLNDVLLATIPKPRMVSFAGWSLPLRFAGIVEECHAVRNVKPGAGLFYIGHMGRFLVSGPDAAHFMRYTNTWRMDSLHSGQGHYGLICRENGGIEDDVYGFRLAEQLFLLVVNAANTDKIWRLLSKLAPDFNVQLENVHHTTAMLAVQGPMALEVGRLTIGKECISLKPRQCASLLWGGETIFISRTGYTGEDGFELVCNVQLGKFLWCMFTANGVLPCGLGARDILRLESALALYGNDINTETNPWEAGLGWVVSLDDGATFLGREALVRLREERRKTPAEQLRSLVCLKAERGAGVLRNRSPILIRGGKESVGSLTSGGWSPMLETSIGMGYLRNDLTKEGTELEVEVRGKRVPATVASRPFYRRPS